MEPKILLIDRSVQVLDVLVEELMKFGRDIVGSNNRTRIKEILLEHNVDMVVLGGGMKDQLRKEIVDFIETVHLNMDVHLMKKGPEIGPFQLIDFINQKVVEWKIANKFSEVLQT